MILRILTILKFNTFLKRLKNLLVIKTWKQIYIQANIQIRIQANNSIMCTYIFFFFGFTDFMVAGKTLIDCTSSFSPYYLKKMTP